MNKKLKEKIMEALDAVLPVTLIVFVLCVTITPMSLATLLMFLVGAVLLIVGMGFFSLGADIAMMPIGEHTGSHLTKMRTPAGVAAVCFAIGVFITIAEPDLQVLARQTPAVPDMVLILCVACGVGVFLALAFLRTLYGWPLARILIICYLLVFALAAFVPREFLPVAFDSGGVTTGPITVPFIMALGLGLSSVGHSDHSDSDSFGLVALCSIGPILAVLVLGLVYSAASGSYTPLAIPEVNTTRELWMQFSNEFPTYAQEVLLALAPILIFFLIFQAVCLHLRKRPLAKILMGMLYTFLGLTLFLTGVNVGFMPAGYSIGSQLAASGWPWLLVPLGMLIGYFIVKAEPAVLVLNRQVEEVLYPAMEDYVIDVMIGKGESARSIRLNLPKFTLVGATTRAGMLSAPLRDRFGVVSHMEYYTVEELRTIIMQSAQVLDVEIDEKGAYELARRSRGTPRLANRLLKRVRDFAQVKYDGKITYEVAAFALDLLEVDKMGLDQNDRNIILTIIDKFDGGPVGLDTLAASLGEDSGTIEDVYEPYLVKNDFINRTPKGRVATAFAYEHFGRTPKSE